MRDKHLYTIRTRSREGTQTLSKKVGMTIENGSVIFLTGDLGCGKTAFVQGLAKGLNVPESHVITSPTFALINEYPGRYPLYHMDLYRLSGLDELEEIGFFDIITGEAVVAIEWADKLPAHLIEEDIHITIETLDETDRLFSIIIYGQKNSDLINHFDLKTNPIYE